MGAKERRDRNREELRTRILDAARELFVSEGVEKVSMRKIAEKIGYSATTLYHHFAEKESLLMAICEEDFLRLRGAFESIAQVPDLLERLRVLGLAYTEFGLKYPSHYRLMFMTPHAHQVAIETDRLRKGNPDQDAYEFLRRTVLAVSAAGHFGDPPPDADLVAQSMWSTVHGVVSLHLIKGNDDWVQWRPVEVIARAAIDTMIAGLQR